MQTGNVAALVLAAGTASRFRDAAPGVPTKLVAALDGEPLVRHAARAALSSRARPVLVVTGHEAAVVERALDGLPVVFGHNADYASGLAGSLRVGLAAVPRSAAGVLVLLGDMPRVTPALLDRLVRAFDPAVDDAVVPVHAGRRGNPALLGRSLFAVAAVLAGDEGARRLLQKARVREIEADEAVTIDVDDPGTLASLDRRAAKEVDRAG